MSLFPTTADEPMLLKFSLCMFDMHADRPMISTSGTFGQSVVAVVFAVAIGATTGLELLASEAILQPVSFWSLAVGKIN